jgi:hypothetical protein
VVDSNYDRVGNMQLSRIMGAGIRMDDAGFDIGGRDRWKQAVESVEAAGGKPYAIPVGASDHPLGGLGFANWARGRRPGEIAPGPANGSTTARCAQGRGAPPRHTSSNRLGLLRCADHRARRHG